VKKTLLQFLLAAMVLFQVMAAQQPQHMSTIILVRHAEKASADPDAVLSAAGQQRAECLSHVLKDSGIKRIYVTDTKRTQQTAEPLAKALGIKPVVVPARDTTNLVQDIFYGAGGNALVVGHSNTLPTIIQRVQAGTVPAIDDNEYDGLYVLTIMEGSSTPVVKMHYCAASPHSAPPMAAETPAKKAPPKKK
jgi:phosphohistidine phosphatase SixA